MKTKSLFAIFLLSALLAPPASAADKTWDRGGGVNNWTTATNWDLDTAPVAADSLFFAGVNTGNSNDFAVLTQFNGLTFNSGANAFTLAGNAITLGGNITNSSSNNQTISLATILAGNIAVNVNSTGSVNLNGAITGNQSITLNGGTSGGIGTYIGSDSRHSFQGTLLVNNSFLYSRGVAGGVIAPGATVNLGSTGTLDLRDRGATIGGLVGSAGSTARVNGGTQTLVLSGSGNYSFAGDIVNGGGTAQLQVVMNYGAGKGGVQTLSGNNTFTGKTFFDSGKLVLDYSVNENSKLSSTGLLDVRGGGTIEIAGGSTNFTQAVNGLALFSGGGAVVGQLNITRSSGTTTLALGAITYGGYTDVGSGAINFSHGNIATTTTGLFNGLLSNNTDQGAARITVGGANWATANAGNIVAYTGYTLFVTSGGNNTLNYELNGGSTATGNLNFNTLKISSSTGSAQTLALGNRTLALNRNGLLLTGTDDYSITADAGGGLGQAVIHNYSTGTLTLGATRDNIEHYGTGKTVLTAASTSTRANTLFGLRLGSGTLQFSNNNQLAGNGNVGLAGGTLIADTSGGDISLTNNSAGGFRTISLGSDVPVIDVIGGGTLTIAGVINTAYANPLYVNSPVVFGSANSSGTIIVTGNNTYTGDTRLDGVKLSVNSNTSLGSTSVNHKVVFSRNSTLNTTANIATSRYYDIYSAVTGTIETDASTTLTHNGTIAGAGNLRKAGDGTLTISGTNTYTGSTTVSAGTLILSGSGSINSSAVTVSGGAFRNNSSTNYTGALTFTSGSVGGTNLNGSLGGLTIGAGQILSPGNSPGTAATTSQTWAGGGSYLFEVNNATGTAGADPGWDLLTGTDTLALTATSGSKFYILLTSLTIGNIGGDAVNFDGALGYSWKLADFANAVTGFDASAFNVNRSAFTNVATGAFSVALGNTVGGDNTQLYLVYTAVPEPATWLLLGLGLATVLVFRRRCR